MTTLTAAGRRQDARTAYGAVLYPVRGWLASIAR